MMRFYGRKKELELLRSENRRDKARLIAVYGRRRVGKTSLIEYAYKDDCVWKFEGIEAADIQIQLKFFLKQLNHCQNLDEADKSAKDWGEAFDILEKYIVQYRKKYKKRLIIFLDEFQWMAEMKSNLVSIFKYYWDNFFSRHQWCDVIICGSVSSFIVKKVVQANALYGRINIEINLLPLTIQECKEFYQDNSFSKFALENYMVIGGVPQYYQEFDSRQSLQQNMNELAFKHYGYFFNEFDRLFISHFARYDIYEKILSVLADRKYSHAELAKKCGVTVSGAFSSRLKELELAGFIKSIVPVDKNCKSRIIQYAINDEYLHFYFNFIQPFSEEIISGNISFQKIMSYKNYEQWQGYAFERLCQKHSKYIAGFLKFSAVKYRSGSWFRRAEGPYAGVQVDLIFVRGDKVLTVCEIKYSKRLSASAIIKAFDKKVHALQAEYHYYAIEKVLIVGNDPELPQAVQVYFDHIITADELLIQ